MDPMLAKEPTEPTENTDPVEPIDRNELREAIESTESLDRMLHTSRDRSIPPFWPYAAAVDNIRVEPQARSSTLTKVIAVIAAILTAGYLLPWAIAAVREVPHWSVFWINLLLGWTIIGWIVALVMSLRMQRQVIVYE